MFNWDKKESPLLGIFGLGGGATKFGGSRFRASGGTIGEPGNGYTYHVFTSPGTFKRIDQSLTSVDFLVIAGGGGGGAYFGGGGGAGGYRTASPNAGPLGALKFSLPASPVSVSVGSGGGGSASGSNSSLGPIISTGGGRGSTGGGAPNDQLSGGSGGGGGSSQGPGGSPIGALGNTPPTSPPQGNPGGRGWYLNQYPAGGGGGAGGAGGSRPDNNGVGGDGGAGYPNPDFAAPLISPILTSSGVPSPQVTSFVSAVGPTGLYAGGGAGGAPVGGAAGPGGGGGPGSAGVNYTGGGGGGSSDAGAAPSGGSGIVIVRYETVPIPIPSVRASGGTVSFYNDRTIHTFTSSGTFTTEPTWIANNVEYIVVGGGGGGGTNYGGGGGAGGYRTGTIPIGSHPVSTTVQIGAGGPQSSGPVIAPNGTPSYFGTPITAAGGGAGAPDNLGGPGSGLDAGAAGGSGGGNGLDSPPVAAAGNSPPTSPSQGNPGGIGNRGSVGPIGAGGGGGGGGGAGAPATSGGLGGAGIQIPISFPSNDIGTAGPDPRGGYLAGGGSSGNPSYPLQGSPNPGGGGYQTSYPAGPVVSGSTNTGGGGGGQFQGSPAGNGGSGIVVIAYPSPGA